MEEIKRCAICGVPIAREGETDWYKYIRVKYCPVCREDVHRQQKAASKRRTRQAVRKAKKEARARVIAAKAENDQLRALLREDPVKCVVHGFTSLGLLEMTRKKTGR